MEYAPVTAQVVQYIQERYGACPEFLWAKSPGNAVFRQKANQKWFAALLMQTPRKRLGLEGADSVDILDLKCDPLLIGSLLDGKRCLPGYHMNKEHWITLLLDGSIPLEEVCGLIDMSYGLSCGKG